MIGRKTDCDAVGDTEGYHHLDIDAWSIDMNDAWIDGATEVDAPFQLASDTDRPNLFDDELDRPTVFGRECINLHNAGYTLGEGNVGDLIERK